MTATAPQRVNCGAPSCAAAAMHLPVPPCDHCRKRYCITHQAPEGHGCRDAARNAAQFQNTRVAAAQKHHNTKVAGKEALLAKIAKQREALRNGPPAGGGPKR